MQKNYIKGFSYLYLTSEQGKKQLLTCDERDQDKVTSVVPFYSNYISKHGI